MASAPVVATEVAGALRLTHLDALRGVAIAGAVLVHVTQLGGTPAWVTSFGAWGSRGVQLFFIVSAITLLSVSRGMAPSQFFIRRFFRIAPMFYLAMVFYIALFGFGPRFYAPRGIGPLDVALTATFLHGWNPNSADSVVPGSFSIGCEAMFYLTFPFLVAWITTLNRAAALFVASCALSISLYFIFPRVLSGPPALIRSFSYFVFPAQLPAFAMGFLVFFAVEKWRDDEAMKRVALIALPVIGLVIIGLASIDSQYARFHLLGDVVLGALALALSLAPVRVLVNPIFGYVGMVSYSVYIIHFAVIEAVRPFAAASPVVVALAYPIVMGVSILLASVTYRWIEKPMIAVGRAVASRVRR
jgi:peptidoglycan/LPS O-acetylase OafA/YrhL